MLYKGQLRLVDSPLQVTMWIEAGARGRLHARLRGALGDNADPDSKPPVIAETQLATVHIKEQRLHGFRPHQREYLQRWISDERAPSEGIWLLDDAAHREDLATFVERAVRLDDAAVIRLRERAGGLVVGLGRNGFRRAGQPGGGGPGAAGRPVARAPTRWRAALPRWTASGYVDPGFAMDSAWRGALPPDIRLRPHRRRARAGGAGPGAAGRRAGQGAQQLARAARVAAGSGGARRQLRATATSGSRCAVYSP